MLIFPLMNAAQQNPNTLLFPDNIQYEGSFRLDGGLRVDEHGYFNYGGYAFAYYPAGDSTGPDDGYPGSLFGTGHASGSYIAEISIPAPVISLAENLADLPLASPLQNFANPYLGIPGCPAKTTQGGLLYLPAQGQQASGKLYGNLCNDYVGTFPNDIHMAWFETNLSNPAIAGLWRLGDYSRWDNSRYLFEIPASWADTNTPGKILACGRCRNWGGEGPNLFACAPWEKGNPPLYGDTIPGEPLMHFMDGTIKKQDKGFTPCNDWQAGAWATRGSRSAVIFLSSVSYSLDHMYMSGPYGPGRYACLLFYDPADLSDVVKGKKNQWEPHWYARKTIDSHFFGAKRPGSNSDQSMEDCYYSIGGMAYDRERGKLYVAQTLESSTRDPLIHVFRIDTATTSAEKHASRNVPDMQLAISPNPFNPKTVITVKVTRFAEARREEKGERCKAEMIIYTIEGKMVLTISDLHLLPSTSTFSVTWDASSQPSGVYIIKATMGSKTLLKKAVLIK
ncbi:MAG: hypothetical protein A2248_21410 [Candidatus Raymondbacteria bacterium RIFOXYA2_FULL_49_16]|nr:MAG: hypothetical protein A2248_21410 [Candidatus Raymondbacteria bacterium RIFOXYA2_FULL_49_16]